MLDFLKALFSESGTVSSTRVMAMISLIAGIAVAFYGMMKYPPEQIPNITILASMFIGSAFTGKVVAKSIEVNKNGSVTAQENSK